jgi:hypothetical protein
MADISPGSIELTVEGLEGDKLVPVEALSSGLLKKGDIAVFVFDDRNKAREAARLVYDMGGDIVSLTPMRGSLEDIFLKEVSHGGRVQEG